MGFGNWPLVNSHGFWHNQPGHDVQGGKVGIGFGGLGIEAMVFQMFAKERFETKTWRFRPDCAGGSRCVVSRPGDRVARSTPGCECADAVDQEPAVATPPRRHGAELRRSLVAPTTFDSWV